MKLTQKLLKELIYYDEKTGEFIWKERQKHHFNIKDNRYSYRTWNTRYSNTIADKLNNKTGYKSVRINKKHYLSHRLVFLYLYNYWPIEIDHIDNDKTNNRINNLREVDSFINKQNIKIRKDCKSGVSGVRYDKIRNKWHVSITINKKFKFIGRFDNFDDAVLTRYNYEIDYNWDDMNNSSAKDYLINKNIIQG